MRRNNWNHLFILPAFIVFSVVFIWPTVNNLVFSFTNQEKYQPDYDWIGFSNYIKLLSDDLFMKSMYNTFYFTFGSAFFLILFSIPLALLLNAKVRSSYIGRAVFFFPSVVSPLLVGYLFQYLFSSAVSGGGINAFLEGVGLSTINFLGTPESAMNSLIVMNTWTFLGWHAVIYLANLKGIPQELYEASNIDGAGKWQQFKVVTLPHLVPGFTVSTFFALVNAIKIYDQVVSLTGGGPGQGGTSTFSFYIIQAGFIELRQGYAATVAVAFLLVVILITIIYLWLTGRLERRFS